MTLALILGTMDTVRVPCMTVSAASGQGSMSLGGSQPVNEFYATLGTGGIFSRFAGVSPVRRTHQLGWVGLAETSMYPVGEYIVWQTYITTEWMDSPVSYAAGNDPDLIYWDMDLGVTCLVAVCW